MSEQLAVAVFCLQQRDSTLAPKSHAHLGLVQPTNLEEEEFLGMKDLGALWKELQFEQR